MFRSAGVKDGCYVWTQDLVAFQRPKRRCFQLLKQVTEAQVQTPLRFRFEAWEAELRGHPDRLFASYILEGLRRGFRTGFDEIDRAILRPRRAANLPAAKDHKEVVNAYLQKECSLGRVLEVKAGPGWKEVHVSPIGVIPKKAAGKWRLIVDLSSPKGGSINDGIDEELASLVYVSIDNITETLTALGPGSFMAKCDIKEAYRLIPIHAEERPFWASVSTKGVLCGCRRVSMGGTKQGCGLHIPLCG